MSDKENLAFPIPNAVLEPYIKVAITTAIASALGDGSKLIEAVVNSAVNEKVNSDGEVSRYSSENRFGLAEVVSRKAIQKIARETIQGLAEEMRPQIEAQVIKQIKQQPSKIAKALVDGLVGSLKTSWMIKVEIPEAR